MTSVDDRSRSRALLDSRLAAALTGSAMTIPLRPDRAAPVPLSAAQSRLWFLDRLGTSGPAHHVRLVLRLRGVLYMTALTGAGRDLAQRHEILHARIEERDTGPLTGVATADEVPVIVRDVEPSELDGTLAAESNRL